MLAIISILTLAATSAQAAQLRDNINSNEIEVERTKIEMRSEATKDADGNDMPWVEQVGLHPQPGPGSCLQQQRPLAAVDEFSEYVSIERMSITNHQGTDGDGRIFKDPGELWKEQDQTWYTKAVSYWDNQEQSYNGVLGGYGFVSDIDVRDSRQLLEKTMKAHFQEQATGVRRLVAIDCGSGVGRVANELLLHLFAEVDLLEPSKPLLDCARKNLEGKVSEKHPSGHRAVNFYQAGLESHSWSSDRSYDCIWIQWCLLYLTDIDFLRMFEKAKGALKPGGLIFVKENICKEGFIVDKEDSSLTRSNQYMLDLFEKANLSLLQSVKQKNFPKELFDVRIYCLKPK